MNIDENKKPSKPKLKRFYDMEIELGPYLDTERKRYVMWSANLLDKEPYRFMVVVQSVRDRRHLGNEKRSPVLYRHVIDINAIGDPMDVHKLAMISGGHELYKIIEAELRKITRPVVRLCGECNGLGKPDAYWATFEPGHATETLQQWREEVLYTLGHKYQIQDWSETLKMLHEVYGDRYGEEFSATDKERQG
jgi:hypothetical protein